MVMGELDRLAVRKKFDVDVAGSKEGILATDEREHATIRRQRGVDSRIGIKSKLLPIGLGRRSFGGGARAKIECHANGKNDYASRRRKDELPKVPRSRSRG